MSKPLPLVTRQGDRIVIVNGLRTPFAKQATAYHGVPAVDLGKIVVSELLARSGISSELIDQLVFGQVVQMPEAPNIAARNRFGYWHERSYRCLQRFPRLCDQFSGGGQCRGKYYCWLR